MPVARVVCRELRLAPEPVRLESARMPDPHSDDALMALAVEGQDAAYVQLVERYQQRVRGFCRMILRDPTLAYDVAQEIFLKICASRNFFSWSHATRAVRVPGLGSHAEASVAVDPAEDVKEQRLRTIESALCQLPEHFRVPLTLLVEGMRSSESHA